MLRNVLDRYDRKARLAPAALAALPLALVLGAAGWAFDQALAGAVAAVLVEFGVPVAMVNYTRLVGRRLEPGLWDSWGGPPGVRQMRHRDATNPHRLALIHGALQQLVPEVRLPTLEEESADPDGADARLSAAFEAARNRLRELDTSRLLFEENCSYGFHRNMLGLRSIAVGTAAFAAALGLGLAAYQIFTGNSSILLIMAAIVALLAMTLWNRLDDTYVERAANSYADAFVGALLSSKSPSDPLRSS